jgi:hypothetical protein
MMSRKMINGRHMHKLQSGEIAERYKSVRSWNVYDVLC